MQKFDNSLKNAIRISRESMKRDGIGKYYLFFVLNFLFSISIFMSPYNVSKWEMANEMKKGNKVSITNIYDNASGKRYFNQLQANVLKITMFVAIILILSTIGAILFFIGNSIYYFSGSRNTSFFWAVPAIVLLAVFFLIVPYIQVPNAYITNTYPSLSPSSVLRFSFYAYKNGGRLRMLLINTIEYGIKLLVLVPFVIAAIVCYNNVRSSANVGFLMLFLSLGFALFVAIYPFVTLPAILMKKELFDEIVFVKNSNKFESTFDFDVDISDKGQTLNNIFGIEAKKEEKFSSIKDKHEKLEEIDKKSKKKEKLKKQFEEVKEEPKEERPQDEIKVESEIEEKDVSEEVVEKETLDEEPKEVLEEETTTLDSDKEEQTEVEEAESNELEELADETDESEEVQEESEIAEETIEEEPETTEEVETEEDTSQDLEETQEVEEPTNETEESEEVVEEVEPEAQETEEEVVEEVEDAEPEQVEEVQEEQEAKSSGDENDEFSNYISGLKEGKKKKKTDKKEK